MALGKGYLSHAERQALGNSGREDFEIRGIEKGIERRVNHREMNWIKDCSSSPPSTGKTLNIVMVGLGGVGKSALGNLLASRNIFKSSHSANAETIFPQTEETNIGDQPVLIMDTPGYHIENMLTEILPFSGQNRSNKTLIIKGMEKIEDGVHVIILVINLAQARTRQKEVEIMEKAKLLNSTSIAHFMLVGTYAQSAYAKSGKEQFLTDVKKNDVMKKFMEKIKDRFVLVELGNSQELNEVGESAPSEKEKEQARRMVMSMVGQVIRDNKTCYSISQFKADIEECFPAESLVYTPHGEIFMEDLQLGDEVLVVDHEGFVKYEKILMFSHAIRERVCTFVTITTEGGKILRLSQGHFIHVGDLGQLRAAQDVNVGDVVFIINREDAHVSKPTRVIAITYEQLQGIYCPHTPSGSIIVDGVLVSCYTEVVPPMVAHLAMYPVRLLHSVLPSDWFSWMLPYNTEQGMPSAVWNLKNMFT